MKVSCISAGQVYAALGLSFTDADQGRSAEVRDVLIGLIDLASEFGKMVNIGRIRGQIGNKTRGEAERLFVDMAPDLCSHAAARDVRLVLEPVNRYESGFVNTVEPGVELLRMVGMALASSCPTSFV